MIDNRCRTLILLTHEYPPYVFGGVATYAKQLAEWLSQNGWKIFIIAGRATFNEKVVLERASNNITVIRIYFPEVPPRWFFMHYKLGSTLR
jgi:mitochondrial fission protein ELM1